MAGGRTAGLLRGHTGEGRVTNIELFFDLVYVFALIQLSHRMFDHPTWVDAGQTLLLLAAVWLVWVHTTWVTNYLNPDRLPVRLMLLAVMLVSLIMSAAIPTAFDAGGLVVAVSFAIIQIGRTIFTLFAVRGAALQRTFERLLVWCIVSAGLWIVGAFWLSPIRELVWTLAIVVDLVGVAVGFYTSGLGRSQTLDWTIRGAHFAERCQAFMLIALGESFLVIGASLSTNLHTVTMIEVEALIVAFISSAAQWWIYFDQSAEAGARQLAMSHDPGRLGRSAYQFVHPIMIAGVIVIAAADDALLAHASAIGVVSTSWMVLGGAALFLAGHALFIEIVWQVIPWSRIAAIIALALLGLLALHITTLTLCICVAAILVGVAVTDQFYQPHRMQKARLATLRRAARGA